MKRLIAGLLAAGVLGLGLSGCGTDRRVPTATAVPRWVPGPGMHWQIQLGGAFDPAVPANIYDLDPYTAVAESINDLDIRGRRTICHLDVGVSDLALPDAPMLPGVVLGAGDGDGRRWLDVRAWPKLEPVLTNRFDLCRNKGFQAIDADSVDGYANPTGFDLTSTDELTFARQLAGLAHSLGLAIAIRTTPALATAVEPYVDFTIVNGCFQAGTCSPYLSYIKARKVVLDVETTHGTAFCPFALVYGFVAIRKPDGVSAPAVSNC